MIGAGDTRGDEDTPALAVEDSCCGISLNFRSDVDSHRGQIGTDIVGTTSSHGTPNQLFPVPISVGLYPYGARDGPAKQANLQWKRNVGDQVDMRFNGRSPGNAHR